MRGVKQHRLKDFNRHARQYSRWLLASGKYSLFLSQLLGVFSTLKALIGGDYRFGIAYGLERAFV